MKRAVKKALIIFVRQPEKGKVKTRLAATVGEDKALAIYIELLKHTQKISSASTADKFVFYAGIIPESDLWSSPGFTKRLQHDLDLGGRMREAFSALFEEGYSKIVIIGSDCLALSGDIIERAFHILNEKEVVIGPAIDGGYYLLGMKKLWPFIFENKQWSTENVFEQTIRDLKKANIPYGELIALRDIDTEEDWNNSKQAQHVL